MAYMSAREMLSGLPMKMAEGGDVKTYGKYGATAQDIQNAATRVQEQMDTGKYDAAAAYAEIMASDISVEDALDAGIDSALIDAIFTSPAGTPAYTGDAATATMSSDVQNYYDKIMVDGIDAAERLEMQKIATDKGLSFDDLIAAGVDPNILYNTTAAKAAEGCPAGQESVGGVCVDICPENYTRNASGNCEAAAEGCPAGQESVGGVCVDICPENYTRNASGNCEADVTVCGDGYMLSPTTGNCIPNNSIPDCGTGEKYNPATGNCEKIFVSTQDPYTADPVYQPLPDNTGVYKAGEESLDRKFRDSDPRTEVIDAYGGLVNFDYTPAADLLSATGSGYNWTPPTVTSRPRSLMGAAQLGRYTGGRAAADLRQLTTGLGNGRSYSDYSGVLDNPGSYSGGLSKSQLYSRMRGMDYKRDLDAAAAGARGGIAAYLAANADIGASYKAQKSKLGDMTLEQFARNHYNTSGKEEMKAGKRGLFTLVESTGGGGVTKPKYSTTGKGGYGGEEEYSSANEEDYETSNWNQARELGEAGGAYRPFFAQGGPVKNPRAK